MKYIPGMDMDNAGNVTPLAGVWIEIYVEEADGQYGIVTPLAGVWIEMEDGAFRAPEYTVTPLAGVWIEIENNLK